MLLLIFLEMSPLLARSRIFILKILAFSSTQLFLWALKNDMYRHWIFRYCCFGIGIVCFILIGIEQLTKSHRSILFGSLLILTLGITGYTSFIPAKFDSLIEGTSNLIMEVSLWGILGLEILINLILLLYKLRSMKKSPSEDIKKR